LEMWSVVLACRSGLPSSTNIHVDVKGLGLMVRFDIATGEPKAVEEGGGKASLVSVAGVE
jgi:hypothetical protein